MSTTTEATSGATSDTSGSEDVKSVETKPADSTSGDDSGSGNDLVAKLKREKDNWVTKAKELEAKLSDRTRKEEAAKEEQLLQDQQFKTLYEKEKERAAQSAKEIEARDKRDAEAMKKAAVRDHLLKLGLRPEHEKTAFRLMDTSTVVVDKETGVVVGDEDAAKTFHESFKDLGFFGTKIPGVSQQAPSTDSGKDKNLRHLKTQKEFDEYIRNKYS